ncbi:MAG: HD-GYP domain-containing protein [Candidatus Omnitrophica bacterium]|nr:HD-GYP domain-containing protein [Candidatus Omnitrophota bacterium]
MHNKLQGHLKKIYDRFSKSIKPVRGDYFGSIQALVKLVEMRDPYTKKHSMKVSGVAVKLAKYMGLSRQYVDTIRLAAILHDIGKLGVKEEILLKESALTHDEYKAVQEHPSFGVDIIKPIPFLSEILPIIRHHHENFDGTGYPDGLKGEEIPLGSRIISIVDVYDALMSDRAYRRAYDPERVIHMMEKEKRKFDPHILKKFMEMIGSQHKR